MDGGISEYIHYITLHYITLHYITLHYIHTYIHTRIVKGFYTEQKQLPLEEQILNINTEGKWVLQNRLRSKNAISEAEQRATSASILRTRGVFSFKVVFFQL